MSSKVHVRKSCPLLAPGDVSAPAGAHGEAEQVVAEPPRQPAASERAAVERESEAGSPSEDGSGSQAVAWSDDEI